MCKKKLNPILFLLYHFFKAIVSVSQWVYYSKVTVVNQERGQFSNPCIVISNHPSTVLDPLNAAVRIKTEVFFLANASLFKFRLTDWLLNRLYCIPIERDKDTGGRPLNNTASFKRSSEHLAQGGCLYIAPEGYSYVFRRLRKVRTGTARIAFAAESHHHFQLGLTILPIGLNYSDPTKFRSRLLTLFGEPVRVADFQQDWERDEVEAVKKLTRHLRDKLHALTLDTADEDEDRLLHCIEEMLQNETPLPPLQHWRRSQQLLEKWRSQRVAKPQELLKYQQAVFAYFDELLRLKISDLSLLNFKKNKKSRFLTGLPTLLFPLFVLGGLAHFLPAFFTKKISSALNDDIHWEATYKYISGLVIYPLITVLQICLVGKIAAATGTAPWLTWAYVISIVPAGLVAEWWLKKWKVQRKSWRLSTLVRRQPARLIGLLEKRAEIRAATKNELPNS